jgi:O-antigen chain-terminating methyltransferase
MAAMESDLELLNRLHALRDLPEPPRRPGLNGWLRGRIKRWLAPWARGALARELSAVERFQAAVVRQLNADGERRSGEAEAVRAELARLRDRLVEIEREAGRERELAERLLIERHERLEAACSAQIAKLEAAIEDSAAAARRLGEVYRELFVSTEAERERLRKAAGALTAPGADAVRAQAALGWLEAREYRRFAERFRGAPEEIRARLADYVGLLAGHAPVLDAGCGRGELLDLLQAAGLPAYGVDLHPEFAAAARARGLDVREQGVLEHLETLEPGALGAIVCAQVLEHLSAAELRRFVELAHRGLRAGGLLIAETIHPGSVYAFSHAYVLDLSHRTPIHPEALRLLLEAAGFSRVEIRLRAPVPEPERLELIPEHLGSWTRGLNRNLAKLNAWLYGAQEYAAIAGK